MSPVRATPRVALELERVVPRQIALVPEITPAEPEPEPVVRTRVVLIQTPVLKSPAQRMAAAAVQERLEQVMLPLALEQALVVQILKTLARVTPPLGLEPELAARVNKSDLALFRFLLYVNSIRARIKGSVRLLYSKGFIELLEALARLRSKSVWKN